MSLVTSLARPFGARALRSARPGSRTRRIAHPRVTTAPRASENEPVVETKGRFKRRDPDAAPPRPGPMGSGPEANAPPSGIKVIPVEQRSRDAFQGVAKVDGDVEDATIRSLKLAAGDVLAIMTFAAIGRGNHGEGMFLGDVFGTALPFLIGWFATAPLTGTFGDDARVSAPPSSRPSSQSTNSPHPSSSHPSSCDLHLTSSPLPRYRAGHENEQRRVRRGQGMDRGRPIGPGASVHRQRRSGTDAVHRRRHGRQRCAARGLEDVVRGCWWVECERRGGREQEGEPAGVHEPAHVPHQALVRETRYVLRREFVNQLCTVISSCHSNSPRRPDSRYFRGVWLFSHKNVMIDGPSLL